MATPTPQSIADALAQYAALPDMEGALVVIATRNEAGGISGRFTVYGRQDLLLKMIHAAIHEVMEPGPEHIWMHLN